MLVSDDEEPSSKARFWATQARDPAPHYQHSEIGYNYRMSNIAGGHRAGPDCRCLMIAWRLGGRTSRHYERSSGRPAGGGVHAGGAVGPVHPVADVLDDRA